MELHTGLLRTPGDLAGEMVDTSKSGGAPVNVELEETVLLLNAPTLVDTHLHLWLHLHHLFHQIKSVTLAVCMVEVTSLATIP